MARDLLDEAAEASAPADRYLAAHLAALRAGAALLAARPEEEPPSRARKPRSVWERLPKTEPELTEWAAVFAASAVKRQSIEAGLAHVVNAAEADDLHSDAEVFVSAIEYLLDIPAQQSLPLSTRAS
ncbi:MAG: chromosome segregation protein SMC [Streptosporangiales bacterium]|nr:chromosome segregation protein SMC [Streptosporangiales bacterium]